MKRTAAILVKNGIGFGHIRRAILVAQALEAHGSLRPVIVSQTSSLALFRGAGVRVVNLPLVHRAASAVVEDFCLTVLDELLRQLDPAVVLEDTYPDSRLSAITSVLGRPRLLLLRRMDGASFDTIRATGALAAYDEILVAQEPHDFRCDGHSGEAVAVVESSGRFRFVGQVAVAVAPEDAARVRRALAATDRPLVVVNSGAGGDQLPDAYGDRLHASCLRVAERALAARSNALFVFVLGPYYAGRPVAELPNVRVLRFALELPALLAGADVAILKPGNNVIAEALQGHANLVLVPDASFLEGTEVHARCIAHKHGGVVTSLEAPDFDDVVLSAIAGPRRLRAVPVGRLAVEEIVRALDRAANAGAPKVAKRTLALAVALPEQHGVLPPRLREAMLLGGGAAGMIGAERPDAGPFAPIGFFDGDVPAASPQDLVDLGVRLIAARSPAATGRLERWLALSPSVPRLALVTAGWLVPAQSSDLAILRRLRELVEGPTLPLVLVDLAASPAEEADRVLDVLGAWLCEQPVELADAHDVLREATVRWLRA